MFTFFPCFIHIRVLETSIKGRSNKAIYPPNRSKRAKRTSLDPANFLLPYLGCLFGRTLIMHSALLIDEILRHVFSINSEDDRPSLVSAALACKAWKDPALDFVWDRLSSFAPLLNLLPTLSVIDGEHVFTAPPSEQDLHRFSTYARRIRHVSNRQELKVHPSVATSSLFCSARNNVLPNLSTAYISPPKTAICLIPFNFSTNLIRLEIDLGFKTPSCLLDDALCEYLEQNTDRSAKLRHLSIRGHASNRLNDIISRLRKLESISLRLGSSLLPQTLEAIICFPNILELEIHAGHIELNDIHDAHDMHKVQDHTAFTSLVKLVIRAKSTLIDRILHYIPTHTLQHLNIELDDSSLSPAFWDTIFATISKKIAGTLQSLSLEHHFEITDPSTSSNPFIPSQTAGGLDVSGMDIKTIELLRNLKNLCHFSCDVTLPPSLNDQDLRKIVTWWPHLQHFELGSSVLPDEFEAVKPSQMTIASLSLFAQQLPHLKTLILPLTISDPLPLAPEGVQQTNDLQRLTIAQLETAHLVESAQYLHRLFPSLRSLEGPCDDSQVWVDTVNALQSFGH